MGFLHNVTVRIVLVKVFCLYLGREEEASNNGVKTFAQNFLIISFHEISLIHLFIDFCSNFHRE